MWAISQLGYIDGAPLAVAMLLLCPSGRSSLLELGDSGAVTGAPCSWPQQWVNQSTISQSSLKTHSDVLVQTVNSFGLRYQKTHGNKTGQLSMKRPKTTFDIQHQGRAVSVELHEEDEFLYAVFLHLISKQFTEGWMPSSSTYSWWKWGKEEEIQA